MGQHRSEDLISEHEQNTSEDVDSKDGDEWPHDSQTCEGNWDSQTARQDLSPGCVTAGSYWWKLCGHYRQNGAHGVWCTWLCLVW
jgi:hypothetical protein